MLLTKDLKVKMRTSCDNCRKRHRKCDGKLPCTRCAELGFHCVYSQRKKRGIQRDHPHLDSLHLQLMSMMEEANKRALMWEKLYYQTVDRLYHLQQLNTLEPEKKRRKIEPNAVSQNSMNEFVEEWLTETVDLGLNLEEITGKGSIRE